MRRLSALMPALLPALLPVVIVGLVGTGAAVSPARAAEASCQGRPATIPGDTTVVTGTEGDDVISLSSATQLVFALGGDDIICVYSNTGVEAGAGDDSVLVTARPGATAQTPVAYRTDLGPGDDTYVGSDLTDIVTASASADQGGANTISTGGGDDSVFSGSSTEPNRDVVDLGAGRDSLGASLVAGSTGRFVAGPDEASPGGSGTDTLRLTGQSASTTAPAGDDWGVYLDTGQVQRGASTVASIDGFDNLVAPETPTSTLSVVGTAGPNHVATNALNPKARIYLGNGADSVEASVSSVSSARLDLGDDAHDSITLTSSARIIVDLEDHLAHQVGNKNGLGLFGVRDVSVVAPRARVEGDRRANVLTARSCEASVQGGAGADTLHGIGGLGDAYFSCRHRSPYALFGEKGDDVLIGSSRPDILVGGPGRDRAVGKAGSDRCVAEKERACER